MKKNILFLILGFVLAFSIAATTTESLFIVKPAIPKSIFIAEFEWFNEAQAAIFKKSKEGFVLKSLATTSTQGGYGDYYVVMEKY
jgi:hypothetical protein